jgi:5-methyltetrahydropteroyltriglutamate--homocysteine methyltransferase
VLGLVSNHGATETRDYLRRRLDEASRHIPIERAALCPRCGFGASNSPDEVVWRKLALIRDVADETWP